MTNERRPRIPADLADRLDNIRDGIPFEMYVRQILERHADHRENDKEADLAFEASRKTLFSYMDPSGTYGNFDRVVNGGWGSDDYPTVVAGFVIDDEDFDTVGIYMTSHDLQALRDSITVVIGDGPWETA